MGKKSKRKKKGGLLKAAAVLFLLLIVAAVGLVIAAPSLAAGAVKGYVERDYSDTIRGRLAVDKLALGWSGGITATATLYDDTDARVATINAALDKGILDLAGGDFGTLVISGDAELTRDTEGVTNLERALAATAPAPTPPAIPVVPPSAAPTRGGPATTPQSAAAPAAPQPFVLPTLPNAAIKIENFAVSLTDDVLSQTTNGNFAGFETTLNAEASIAPGQPIALTLTAPLKTTGTSAASAGTLAGTLSLDPKTDAQGVIDMLGTAFTAELKLDGIPSQLLAAIGADTAGLGEQIDMGFSLAGSPAEGIRLEAAAPGASAAGLLAMNDAGTALTDAEPIAITLAPGDITWLYPVVSPDLAELISEDGGFHVAQWPTITASLTNVSIPVPQGAAPFNPAGATFTASLAATDLAADIPAPPPAEGVEQAPDARLALALPAWSINASTDRLASGLRVTGSLAPTIGGQRLAALNIDLTATGLASEDPSKPAAPGYTGTVTLAGAQPTALQPFVAAMGLDMNALVGPSLTAAIAATQDEDGNTTFTIAADANTITLRGAAMLDTEGTLSTPRGIALDYTGLAALAPVLGEGVNINTPGAVRLAISDLSTGADPTENRLAAEFTIADTFGFLSDPPPATGQPAAVSQPRPFALSGTRVLAELNGPNASLVARSELTATGTDALTLDADLSASIDPQSGSLTAVSGEAGVTIHPALLPLLSPPPPPTPGATNTPAAAQLAAITNPPPALAAPARLALAPSLTDDGNIDITINADTIELKNLVKGKPSRVIALAPSGSITMPSAGPGATVADIQLAVTEAGDTKGAVVITANSTPATDAPGSLTAAININDLDLAWLDSVLGEDPTLSETFGSALSLAIGLNAVPASDATETPTAGFDSGEITIELEGERITAEPVLIDLAAGRATLREPRFIAVDIDRDVITRAVAGTGRIAAAAATGNVTLNIKIDALDWPMTAVAPGATPTDADYPTLDISAAIPEIALALFDGKQRRYTNLLVKLATTETPGDLHLTANLDQQTTAGEEPVHILVGDLTAAGALAPNADIEELAASGSITLTDFPTSILEGLSGGGDGVLAGLVGPQVSAGIALDNFPMPAGTVSVSASSNQLDLSFNGSIESIGERRDLVAQGVPTARISQIYNAQGFNLGDVVPVFGQVLKDPSRHAPAQITVSRLRVPLDGTPTSFILDTWVDPGEIEYAVEGGLAAILKIAGQNETATVGTRLTPIRVQMSGGTLAYSNLTVPVGEFFIPVKGNINLVQQTEYVELTVPAGAVAGELIGGSFGSALSSLFSVPIVRQGPLGANNQWKVTAKGLGQGFFGNPR